MSKRSTILPVTSGRRPSPMRRRPHDRSNVVRMSAPGNEDDSPRPPSEPEPPHPAKPGLRRHATPHHLPKYNRPHGSNTLRAPSPRTVPGRMSPANQKPRKSVTFGEPELIPKTFSYEDYGDVFEEGEIVSPFNVIFDNQCSCPVGILVHIKSLQNHVWKTEGWFKLDPGEKGLTGTSERSIFYYYGEMLGDKEGLDRQPKWSRSGWWGEHEFGHNFSDVLNGFRQFQVTEPNSNLVIPLRAEDANQSDDKEDEESEEDDDDDGGLPPLSRLENRGSDEEPDVPKLTRGSPANQDPEPPSEPPLGEDMQEIASHLEGRLQQADHVQAALAKKVSDLHNQVADVRNQSAQAIADLNEFFDEQQRKVEHRRHQLLAQLADASKTKSLALSAVLSRVNGSCAALEEAARVAKEAVGEDAVVRSAVSDGLEHALSNAMSGQSTAGVEGTLRFVGHKPLDVSHVGSIGLDRAK